MADVRRFGIVIGVNPERIDTYRKVHADDHPGVRDLLQKYNIHNFSIFIKKLDDGKEYLFGYYEYTGDDYDADMAGLGGEKRNEEWLAMCDPCQIPLDGYTGWAEMERVYYND